MIISRWISFRMKNVADNSCRENQNMNFMFNDFFFFFFFFFLFFFLKQCRSGQATDDNRPRRMRFACWIPTATGTHSVSNTYCFSTGCTNTPHCYVTRQVPVLLSPKVIPAFCRTSCIYKDVIRVTLKCTWIIYSQLCNPSPCHFWSLLYFWPQPKGLWHFQTTRYVNTAYRG
jgi:hypothetical protein